MPTAVLNAVINGPAGAGGTNPNSSRNSPALAVTAPSSNGPTSSSRMRAATQGTASAANGASTTHAPNLSSMRSAPLDLTTVERRGHPTEVPEPVEKKRRPWDLEEAPTYFPTEEDWRDPIAYMRKISPEARQYGICKIVPPDSWNPDFAIDTERFHFKTRKQELNSVEGSTRANLTYLDGLGKFHKQQGTNLHRLPYVDKKPLDLYKLKKCVETRGGFAKVCKGKKWAEIGRDLGYSGKIMSSLSTSLKNSYQKWLEPYEEYLKLAKPGVHQQLEYEYGGPLGEPSPARTPMKKSGVFSPPVAGSPARHATDALRATLNGHANSFKDPDEDEDTPMPDASPTSGPRATPAVATPAPSSGFRAINSGGFTAVNSGFTSANAHQTPLVDPPSQKSASSATTTAKNTPDVKHTTLAPASSLKRQLSCESFNSASRDGDGEDGEIEGRRSKRAKKEENAPTVAGSHMTLFRATAPRAPRDEWAEPGERCEQCGKGDQPNTLVTCESCDHAYHGTCLDPPLKQKPDSDWNCPRCLVGDGNFGFEDGGVYSLRQFQMKAAQFKQSYFENKMPVDSKLGFPRPVTEEDVEREFWRLVVDLEETVEVEYGADIHCTTHGSGFPTMERHPTDPYSTDPWNLNVLPLYGDSLFRHIKSDVSGMTVPWVYVGMTFSTFCWHNEDHYSYSANYQHFGATKTWYGIPGEDAEKFEQAMRDAVPELFETQPDLLFQLVTLLTPEHLRKAGVRVYALDQRAGQLVVTFPQAYHAGFNHGFNFNEAVNFAPCDWEPYGLAGIERLQLFRRQPCFSHDELLWTAAEGISGGGLTIETAKWLHPAMEKIHARELQAREEFMQRHLEAAGPHDCPAHEPPATEEGESGGGSKQACPLRWPKDEEELQEDEYACTHCKGFAYLSRFKCVKTGTVLCLAHAGQHPCCEAVESDRFLGSGHALVYRKSNYDLMAMSARVTEKARMPEAWEEKYNALLEEESRPSLRSLRNLLHEGERIPYALPSLATLRQFVERCNSWVDEATNYTAVRKHQQRRKSENRGNRKSTGLADKRELESRTIDNMLRLVQDAERIGFDCPEIGQLQERAVAIEEFQRRLNLAIDTALSRSAQEMEDLLEEARTFNVDIPQIEHLSRLLEQLQWNEDAGQKRGTFMTMEEVETLVAEGKRLQIPAYNDHLKHYEDQMQQGRIWEKRAQEIMSADTVHHPQLEALSNQVQQKHLPVSRETYDAVDHILHKHREAQKQILDILQRAENPEIRQRPKYGEMVAIMKKIEDLNSKPTGVLDLEKEQKRHEDWMRRGKKLFGKTNAPLHILKSHMEYVLERNRDCFDTVHDKPRHPAEPSSRANSPSSDDKPDRTDEPGFREVFCICRKPEAGLMIECEVCHEWYHSRCLKIARGKIKEEDKYTCPICDWRVKIPRDAARPKVEDLMDWYDEIMMLPFQPEEEDVLKDIIESALEFRRHVHPHMNKPHPTNAESETQRFFLRKIEGAEILLAVETNHLRQELHKWCPVAPEPPPVRDVSLSTRKPRPTKLQKILIEHKVDNIEDLPEDARVKAMNLRRKQANYENMMNTYAARKNTSASSGSATTSPTYATSFFGQQQQHGAHPATAGPQRAYSIGGLSSSPTDSVLKETPGRTNGNAMIHPALLGDTSNVLTSPLMRPPFEGAKAENRRPAPPLSRPVWSSWGSGQEAVLAPPPTRSGADGGDRPKQVFMDLTNDDDDDSSRSGSNSRQPERPGPRH